MKVPMPGWLQELKKARAARRRAPAAAGSLAEWWHFHITDHGLLRLVWTNFDTVAPGVYRSNQPSPERLARQARDLGLRTVLSLRGDSDLSFSTTERAACARLGLAYHIFPMSARALVSRDDMIALHDLFCAVERPLLIHCKSGADRTGYAAALYLLMIEGAPVARARRQLHWTYAHLSATKSGILDHVLDVYEAAQATTGIGFMDWVRQDYDAAALTASYAAGRRA